MQLQLSRFFPLCSPPSIPHSPQAIPSLCSCPWVMHTGPLATPFPVLYFTSPWLFHDYQIVLNPLNFSPITSNLYPSGNHQNTICIHASVSVLFVFLVCFLDSIVHKYVFIAILLFIILTFSFLNKSL